jgi:hypothetical protein
MEHEDSKLEFKSWAKSIPLWFLGGILLSLPSLLNGFPFIFYDSGFYILHAVYDVNESSLIWRPLTYSIFLKSILSFGGLLSFIVAQNVLLSAILHSIVKIHIPQLSGAWFLGILLSLFLTPFFVFSNFIMPDVFLGIMILCLSAVIVSETRIAQMMWLALFCVSTAMHYSNILIGSALTLVVLLIWFRKQTWPFFLPALLLPPLLLALANFATTDRFVFSNAHHVFIFSQLSTLGVVQPYLDESCENSKSRLCLNRNIPFHIWDSSPNGRIGQAGGLNTLLPDIAEANHAILTSRRLITVLKLIPQQILRQLLSFSEPLRPTIANSYLNSEISMYSQDEAETFYQQKIQNLDLGELLKWFGYIFMTTAILSISALSYFFFAGRLSAPIRIMFLIACGAFLLNAIICGVLTDPNPRYGGRLVWIFPFLFVVQLTASLSTSRKNGGITFHN